MIAAFFMVLPFLDCSLLFFDIALAKASG